MRSDAAVMPRRLSPPSVGLDAPAVSNARLAMVAVIAGEAMLFAGLIGTYLVFRLAAPKWPPADLPRLPLVMTGLNTLVLLASLMPMAQAMRAVNRDDRTSLRRAIARTAGLGTLFLAIQGTEWARLVHHGLTLASSMYGATFYVLIGCHAALEMCAIYWYFVCGLWLVLFPLVYLY